MKQSEIKKCTVCGEGVMHDNCMTFYTAKIEYMVVDIGAVQRQHGLEMFMGSGQLAAIMGTNEDIAKPIDSADIVICMTCAMQNSIASIMENVSE